MQTPFAQRKPSRDGCRVTVMTPVRVVAWLVPDPRNRCGGRESFVCNNLRAPRGVLKPAVTSARKQTKRAAPGIRVQACQWPRARVNSASPVLYETRHSHPPGAAADIITDKKGVGGGCGSTKYVGTAVYSKVQYGASLH